MLGLASARPNLRTERDVADLTRLTLAEARDGLRAKRFTAAELTQAFLAAIDKANPALNAYVAVTPEIALEQAK
jgi:aspartyl-tRNA(Asn)/glutamyl-tRNA(Gln) amidotransferase subunit A